MPEDIEIILSMVLNGFIKLLLLVVGFIVAAVVIMLLFASGVVTP